MKRGITEVMRRRGAAEEERGSAAHKRRRTDKKGSSDLGFAIEEIRLSTTNSVESKAISTEAFIAASNLLLLVLDKIGPVMVVLRNDVKQNIERLEEMYVLNPGLSSNLVEILRKEVIDGMARKPKSCTRAIVWLTRSINFSTILVEKLLKDPELNLQQAVEEAYEAIFKPWHGWISSAAYKVALKLIPDRTNFINLLVDEKKDQNLLKKYFQDLLSLLQPFLDEMNGYLREFQVEKLTSK